MIKPLFIMCSLFAAIVALGSDHSIVRITPSEPVGPRPLDKQTETAVIREYLQAWRSLGDAFEQNRVDLLDPNFIGSAKEKLADTIREQARLGIHTRYRDTAHDVRLVFYSPEGLSIQLVDTVEYDIEVVDRDKVQSAQHVRARYIAVLTPTEVRWKVRVFQAKPE